MTLGETLISVWEQALAEEKSAVELDGDFYRVETTPNKRLRTVEFTRGRYRIEGIEQNPETQLTLGCFSPRGVLLLRDKSARG